MFIENVSKKKEIKINENIPKHIALIMDGNGRWAKERGLPRSLGREEGAKRIKEIVNIAKKIGVSEITFFAFSTENQNRPTDEMECIFDSIKRFLKENKNEFMKEKIKLSFIGNLSLLKKEIVDEIYEVINLTKDNKFFTLNIALNYGVKEEIAGVIKIEDVDCNEVEKQLRTKDLSQIDLMITTGCDQRLSNFSSLQVAYCEFIISKAMWPDYNKNEFLKSIKEYQEKDKRFGGIKK